MKSTMPLASGVAPAPCPSTHRETANRNSAGGAANGAIRRVLRSMQDRLTIMAGMVTFWCRGRRWATSFRALNGQERRKELVSAILGSYAFDGVVETGSYFGETTLFLARSAGVPVYTVENNPKYYGFVKARLMGRRRITSIFDDSRSMLRRLTADSKLTGKQLFFYLDAHWGADLPLREELEIIFAAWPNAVVMIDDFQVPNDSGYGYDDYGPGSVLCLDYLQPLSFLGLVPFFPAAPSEADTGARRGCVVLARDPAVVQRLCNLCCLTARV